MLSPTKEWALFGLESLWPRFLFLEAVLLGDSSKGVSSTVVVSTSCSLFLWRSLFFGTSEISMISSASGEMPSYKNIWSISLKYFHMNETLFFFRRKRTNIISSGWWAKPQVHGSTDVVIKEYRSERELVNLINFEWWLERELSRKGLIFNGRK